MACSMAVRSCALGLMMLIMVSQTYGQQCNTTLLQAVQETPELAQLAGVIAASGLSNTLNRTDNVTVFAPNNAAFNGTNGLLGVLQSNNLTLANVTSSGNNRAASILLYHIVNTVATAAQLTNGESLPTALGAGYNLTVAKTTTVTIIGAGSNATVVTADIKVCNSVVHIVNAVLLPATSLAAIPVYNGSSPSPSPVMSPSGTSSLAIGSWAFGLSAAMGVAMLM